MAERDVERDALAQAWHEGHLAGLEMQHLIETGENTWPDHLAVNPYAGERGAEFSGGGADVFAGQSGEHVHPGWRNRLWLWLHGRHAHRDLTGPIWRCSCGSWVIVADRSTLPGATP